MGLIRVNKDRQLDMTSQHDNSTVVQIIGCGLFEQSTALYIGLSSIQTVILMPIHGLRSSCTYMAYVPT